MKKHLLVENPCPVQLLRMKKKGDNFHCKSCSKTVVDFRSKTNESIVQDIDDDTCGVFYADQLPKQLKLKGIRKAVFYAMACFSIFGFNVSPAMAQTTDTVKIEKTQKPSTAIDKPKTELKENKKGKKRSLFRRKRKKNVVIGCPSF